MQFLQILVIFIVICERHFSLKLCFFFANACHLTALIKIDTFQSAVFIVLNVLYTINIASLKSARNIYIIPVYVIKGC